MSEELPRRPQWLTGDLKLDLVEYYYRSGPDATIEWLRETTTERHPVADVREAVTKSNLLRLILTGEEAALDIAKYLVELAPDVVGTVHHDGGERTHSLFSCSSQVGSLPIHVACENRDCPDSVIKFLIEKYPAAAKHSWLAKQGGSLTGGFPLHCYLGSAINEDGHQEYDPETDELIEEHPPIPGRKLDHDIVKMLVTLCPEALTATTSWGSPMNIFSQGSTVTLELARLLTDKENKCFEVDDLDKHEEFPLRKLLRNKHVDSFPTDVFHYFVECDPSSLRRQKKKPSGDDDDGLFGLSSSFAGTLLHIACSNPKISVEAIRFIINECPQMSRRKWASDGYLPLHNLCSNKDLDDVSSMEILKILVQKYPESATERIIPNISLPFWCSRERGENDLPIHLACRYKSSDFCRYLVEKYPESVMVWQLHYNNEVLPHGSLMLPFHLACKYGSLDLVQFLYEQHPSALGEQTRDFNYKYDQIIGLCKEVNVDESNASLLQTGNYPLHLAASRELCPEKTKIINFLVHQDVDAVSRVGKYGNLPLHSACWHPSKPDIDIVTLLFQSHPTAIRTSNIFGQLPIHLAIQTADNESSFEGLSFLARQQSNALGHADARGMSCAHYACSSEKSLKKLELIAELCPEAFRCESDSCGLPIHYACTEGCDEKVLQYLIAQYPESLAVHVGSMGSPLHCVKDDFRKFRMLRLLLEERYGALVESGLPIVHAFLQDEKIRDKDRIIALHPFSWDEAAEEDRKGRILAHHIFRFTKDDALIKRYLEPESLSKQDRNGWLPLHHAIRHNASPGIVEFILHELPEHTQLTDNEGRTPLHAACRWSKLAVIKVILEEIPELVRMRDSNGCTAVHHACQYGRSKKTILFSLNENIDLIEMNDNKGRGLLHAACDGGAPYRVVHFLSKFPSLIPVIDKNEQTILHAACGGEAPLEVVQYLVDELGCDTAAVDSIGELALHKACRLGNVPVIEYLLAKDMAAVFARNNLDELPIHVLSNRSGKKNEVLESTEYTGAVLKLLLAYPETVDIDQTSLASR